MSRNDRPQEPSKEGMEKARAVKFFVNDLGYAAEHLQGRLGQERIDILARFYDEARADGERIGLELAAQEVERCGFVGEHAVKDSSEAIRWLIKRGDHEKGGKEGGSNGA